MMSCDRCGKGLQVGMNVSHAHNRTKRRTLPNLHTFRVPNSGKMKFCTKCLRVVKAEVAKQVASKPTDFVKKEKVEVKKEEVKTLEETLSSL